MPWETYMAAHLISDKDLHLIRKFDKRSQEVQKQVLEENGVALVETLCTVLRNVTKEEIMQYVLALLDEIVTSDSARAQLFHQQKTLLNITDLYIVFLRLLQRTDWFIQEKACKLLTLIFLARPNKELHLATSAGPSSAASTSAAAPIASAASAALQGNLVSFINWLCGQLRRPSNPQCSVPAAVSALGSLLKEAPVRELFTRTGGVQLLAPLLRGASAASPNQQLLYDAGLAAWQLTFYHSAAEIMGTTGLLTGFVEVVRSGQKEKVVRTGLLALKQLLGDSSLDFGPDLVEAGLLKIVTSRAQQNWEDEDISALLTWLEESLRAHILDLSNFDKYKKEVLSGSLDWSPMHTSEQFWRENVCLFEERDFQILRVLLKLLESSRQPRTLAVACHDLGQFITYYPAGKGIVTDLKGKERVLHLVQHPDPEVQKNALLATQKILLSRDKVDYLAALN